MVCRFQIAPWLTAAACQAGQQARLLTGARGSSLPTPSSGHCSRSPPETGSQNGCSRTACLLALPPTITILTFGQTPGLSQSPVQKQYDLNPSWLPCRTFTPGSLPGSSRGGHSMSPDPRAAPWFTALGMNGRASAGVRPLAAWLVPQLWSTLSGISSRAPWFPQT